MDRRNTEAFLYAGMDSNSQSSGFQPPPPGVGPIGPRSYAPPFPMQPRGPPGVGPMGPQCYVPPLPMQPRWPPGVGPMGPQSYAPPFPMQQGQTTLGSQQFCSVGHGISSHNVGMPSSQGQPLQFSQPMQQLPSRLGHPNIPQTQQFALHLNQHMPGLGGPGAPFSSSYSGSFSSSHTQPNAPNVSSQFRPLSEMHAYGASHVTPVQVTGQQPSVTASTVPQPNAPNVSSQFRPLSEMHACSASHVTPVQVTGQQPSVTASTVPQPNAPNVSSQFRPLSKMHACSASHVTPVQVTGQQLSVTASTVPQPNALNVSSQFRPLSEMHACSASHVTPVQVTGQQPSVTASTVPVTGQQPSVTASTVQITHTMQVSLIKAEDIIGIAGANVSYVHRTSGANLTVSETEGIPEEMTVKIKGTYSEVLKARRLIQECLSAGAKSMRRGGV
ncbi:verprolin-like isoform X2 [Cornus florida]|uniref:verprolin-like isoform X2 n=1 Tax=Cornus florida TaxID=4283 RepID=UPI0028964B4F|nr:verprolin-like isoform X2 [Cornus florida]